MHHAINAGKRRAPTLVTMRIELLLGEDIAASLVDERKKKKKKISRCCANRSETQLFQLTSHENDTILTPPNPRIQQPLSCQGESEYRLKRTIEYSGAKKDTVCAEQAG